MASGTAGHTSSPTSAEFGANDWLIDEMREQFQRDPDSVGPEWVTFFQAEERTSAPR
ncbi:2-oxoglutarate dehydrogenase E1 subunit family protein, partial [Acidipropionibacterium jensenii]